MKVLLSVQKISKTFGSVVALKDVSIDIYENEIIGLVGDNGAGKSTLIKIISGNFQPDSGHLEINGMRVFFRSPIDARKMGIETVYQHLSLCNNLDSISNLFVGRELFRDYFGLKILKNREMAQHTIQALNTIDIQIPSIRERVEYLSGGQRQAISLGRFVMWGKKLVMLDEATAALGVRETRKALELVARIQKERGISIILVSHNLQSVFEIVDRIVVLRLGEVAGIREKKNTTPEEIVSLITGAKFALNQK